MSCLYRCPDFKCPELQVSLYTHCEIVIVAGWYLTATCGLTELIHLLCVIVTSAGTCSSTLT